MGDEWQDFSSDHDYSRLVRAVREADNLAFPEARAIYCIFRCYRAPVAPIQWTNRDCTATSAWKSGAFHTGKFGNYVLALGSDQHRAKRQELLIEAMATVTTDMRLVVTGAPERRLS